MKKDAVIFLCDSAYLVGHWQHLNLKWIYFTEICSKKSNEQYFNVGSYNGLALARQQTIIWAKDD